MDYGNPRQTDQEEEIQPLTNAHTHSKQGMTKKKKIVIGVVVTLVVIGVALGITLPLVLKKKDPEPPNPPKPPNPDKFQEFNPFEVNQSLLKSSPFSLSGVIEYKVNTLTNNLLSSALQDEDPTDTFTYKPINPKVIPDAPNNPWAKTIEFNFGLLDNNQVRFQLKNLDNPDQYHVSNDVFSRPDTSYEARLEQINLNYNMTPFSFDMSNVYTGETVITTSKRKLVVSEKFSEIGFTLPTKRIFGLGQHNSQFMLKNGTYTLWARGLNGTLPIDHAEGGVSGSHIHPFLLAQTANPNDFIGMFFVGTAAQAFEIVYFEGYNQTVINYITLGGDIEIYFFIKGSAEEIIQRYHSLIGYSQMPPYYALGLIQGTDYMDSSDFQKMVQAYDDLGMSIEGYQLNWGQHGQLFTQIDSTLNETIASIQSKKQVMFFGLSAGIDVDPQSQAQKTAQQYEMLIQSNLTEDALIGKINDIEVNYPDFYSPQASNFYQDGFKDISLKYCLIQGIELYSLQFDNLYMGEKTQAPQSAQQRRLLFNQTEEDIGQNETYLVNENQTEASWYYVPFIPGFTQSKYLDNRTISPNATHSGYGDKNKTMIEYFLHNANGHIGIKTVKQALEKAFPSSTQRKMIFSDTTWAGSGSISAGLITNLERNWENMKNTISMAMSLSMYGISNTVVDVCGTIGPLTEELCARWMQLAAFLPMARNYYPRSYLDPITGKYIPNPRSEFTLFQDYNYQYMASSAIHQRLAFSRYIYTQMYLAYREGGSLVKPMFFYYPEDDNCFDDTEHTYFFGEAIKVSPVLQSNNKNYDVYFPKGFWVNLNDYKDAFSVKEGKNITLTANDTYTNIHLKAGKIIPYQQKIKQAKTTYDYQTQLQMQFVINRNKYQYAEGHILVDDGISKSSYEESKFALWQLRYTEKSINFWIKYGDYNYQVPEGMTIDQLSEMIIVQAEDLNTTDFACYFGLTLNPMPLDVSYNQFDKTLRIKPQGDSILRFKDINTIKFGDSKKDINLCDVNVAQYQADMPKMTSTEFVTRLNNIKYPNLIEPLMFSAKLMDNKGTLSVSITTLSDFQSPIKTKYRVPFVTDNNGYEDETITAQIGDFFQFKLKPFSYSIIAKDDPKTVLYKMSGYKLLLTDYLVMDVGEFSMNPLTNFPLMGLGERAGDFYLDEEEGGVHTRYTYDQANPIDNGVPPGNNMYGVQPFYVYQTPSTDFLGVFNLNSYAQDYIINFNKGVNTNITTIMIGGSIQKYFFRGKKPDDVISAYQKLVGYPIATPFWTFGWQQSKFGYVNDTMWYDVVQNYTKNDMPLDTMWADIDYLDNYKIFTISEAYKNLPKYVDEIHKRGMTFVPIIDPAVATRFNMKNYKALELGKEMDVFIKTYDNKTDLEGGLFCGNALYPDFTHPNGTKYWHKMLDYVYNDLGLKFDGIWLDENEPTSTCVGSCKKSQTRHYSIKNKIIYTPGDRDLDDKTLSIDALHYNNWTEYDMHNLYSLYQTKATSEYMLTQLNMKPYVLSRGNFPGLGKYGHHWLGDNWTTQKYLQLSVDGLYGYSLFGIPFIGSDICGFNSYATSTKEIETICTRWHQLGSLYPFSRNHNQNATIPHEPYRFSELSQNIIRQALRARYRIVRYYFSNFMRIAEFGGSFFKPLSFEYPNDPKSYQNISNNIMLGNALKASIQVTDITKTMTEYYFPEGTWCLVYPYAKAASDCFKAPKEGLIKSYPSDLANYQVHLRAGHIVPTQDAVQTRVNTTKDLYNLPLQLSLVPLSQNSFLSTDFKTLQAAASGFIYFNDDQQLKTPTSRFDMFFVMGADSSATILFFQERKGQRLNQAQETIESFNILFVKNTPMDILKLDKLVAYYYKAGQPQLRLQLDNKPVYDKNLDMLVISLKYNNQLLSIYDIDRISILIPDE